MALKIKYINITVAIYVTKKVGTWENTGTMMYRPTGITPFEFRYVKDIAHTNIYTPIQIIEELRC